jgi:protein regulator of cytokinesis 1
MFSSFNFSHLEISSSKGQLFEDIHKWEVLYRKMLEHEKKANDPNRFNNRGGRLLQEEKERKKVLKELPKVEEEVKNLIAEWERQQEKL